jgi:hypothetical protein
MDGEVPHQAGLCDSRPRYPRNSPALPVKLGHALALLIHRDGRNRLVRVDERCFQCSHCFVLRRNGANCLQVAVRLNAAPAEKEVVCLRQVRHLCHNGAHGIELRRLARSKDALPRRDCIYRLAWPSPRPLPATPSWNRSAPSFAQCIARCICCPSLEGYAVTSAYRRAQQVGDFFQLIKQEGDSGLLILGDVSGKGVCPRRVRGQHLIRKRPFKAILTATCYRSRA